MKLIRNFSIILLVMIGFCWSVAAESGQNPFYPGPNPCNGAGWSIGLPKGVTCSGTMKTASALENDPRATAIFGVPSRLKPDLTSLNKFCQQYTNDSSSWATYAAVHNFCSGCDQRISWWTGSQWLSQTVCRGTLNVQSVTCGIKCSPCTSHFTKKCVGNAIYWFDSCGKQEDLVQTCGANQICRNAQCLTIACSTKSDCGTDGYINQPYCRGNSVYQDYVTYTCHNPGTTSSYCSSSTTARLIQTCSTNQQCMNGRCETTTTCYPYYYKRCVGNHLYWFDSCNNQQELIQYCPAGCEFDRCKSYWSIFTPTCVSHAYKLCVGNAIYWFDSCHNRQELVQQCPADQTCQYGQCVNIQPPASSYNPYFRIGCYLNSLYWYDSFGVRSGIYKSCVDNNPCTEDTCLEGKCLNILKCDGSTCARGSPEYQNYCFGNSCGNKVCDHNLGENPLNCPNDCSLSQASIQFTFLAKTDVAPEWSRKIDVASGNRIYFKIGIKNQNNFPLDGSKLMVNFPVEILQPENIKINDISLSGDLSRGVEIQRIEANQETIITFEADTQKITEEVTKEIASSLNYAGSVFQDLIQIHFVPPKVAGFATAAIEPSIDEKKFWEKWSWWIIGLIVFILLFFIVFRRLSKTS